MSKETQIIHEHRLDNGLTLVFEPMPWLPSVSFTVLVPFGAASDPEGFEGSATVLYDWLQRGAAGQSSRVTSEALEDLGVRRGGSAGKEYATFSASLLVSALAQTLEHYAAMLKTPNLADDEFEPARTLALEELAALEDQPAQRLFNQLPQVYFASSHGNSSYGTQSGLQALGPEGTRDDYARRLGANGAVISVAGGADWEALKTLVERRFGDWQGQTADLPEVALNGAREQHVQAETAQVQIGLAYESVRPDSPDWYKNALAMNVLSGGMGARLFSEVREKRGLVYSVAAVNRALRGFGYALGYAGTTPENAEETLSVMKAELRKLSQGVTEDELERARTGLLSQLVMQGESSGARASALARDYFLLGRARTVDEVKEAVASRSLKDVNAFLAAREEPEFTVLTLGPVAERVA